MNTGIFMLLPILLPILGAVSVLWLKPLRDRKVRRSFVCTLLTANVILVLLLVFQPDLRWEAWHFTDSLGVLFKTDALSRLFTVLVSIIWLLAGIYACSYMEHEGNEARFFLFYLLTQAALIGLGFAGNFLTLYLFFELMTLVSTPMVLHSMTKESISAALKYLFYSVAGASMALLSFFLIQHYGFTTEFLPGGVLDMEKASGHQTLLLIGAMLAIVGFGTKAGMFPMHSWLPTAHPVAPSPASAVLSGIITKAGVLALIRVVFYQFGADFLRGTWVQYTWIVLCLITVFMGSMLAFKERQLKKRLAYSSVSQVSYILLGLSLLTGTGMLGALLHMVFHALIKNGLFMVAGAILFMTHKTKVEELRAIGRQMPVVMGCFTLFSLALVGIPPFSGAISKWYLATASLSADTGALSWIAPVVLLSSALLTAGYLLSISIHAFLTGTDSDFLTLQKKEPDKWMLVPLIALCVPALGLGMFPGALIRFLSLITGGLF